MDLDAAQLSSLATSLGDLVDRVTTMAEGFQASPREDIAADLYEVERNLQAAHRRLRALVAKLT
jgi:Mg2+ and Co2+ transporter CorA